MKIDVNKLDEFMNTVNKGLNENDPEMVKLAEAYKQAITQFNIEVRMGVPQQMEPAIWVEQRQQFGWPQQLQRFLEAYEKQEAGKATQDGGNNELLNEVKALKAQVAKLLEAQSAPSEESPAESTEENQTEPENAAQNEESDESEGNEEAPEEEA